MPNPQNLVPFTSTRQPANRGRKPNYLKRFLKENGIGTADIRSLLGGILVNCKNIADLEKLLKDPKTPPIVLFPVRALLKDMIRGKLTSYEFLLRYSYGEPKQEIDTTFTDQTNYTNLSAPELRKIKLDTLRKIFKDDPELFAEAMRGEQENDSSEVQSS